ncbi:MAG: NINE protein [Cytophagales bacterium]|nr:MAG: NINE protein [Cytophagales bacterium]
MEKKDKGTAALLAFFTGSLGIHRFYLGDYGTGIIYLFTAGLCGIGSIIDFFNLLMISKDEFDRRYNPHLFLNTSQMGRFITNANINPSAKDLHVADEIEKLNQLFEKKVITFEEFENRKKRLLDL